MADYIIIKLYWVKLELKRLNKYDIAPWLFNVFRLCKAKGGCSNFLFHFLVYAYVRTEVVTF